MVARGFWDEKVSRYIRKRDIRALELNDAKGWKGGDLSFLSELPDLETLIIIDWGVKDISPISSLKNLRNLHVDTFCKTKIDFADFPHLEDCYLEWRRGAHSIFDCTTLKKLYINKYTTKTTAAFHKLSNLEALSLANGSVADLSDLKTLNRLTFLGLYNLRRLTSLSGIEPLVKLTTLEIYGCSSLRNIRPVEHLVNLERFLLCDDRQIESIKPISALRKLREFLFYGTTNIADGDLSPLLNFSRPFHVTFQNRRHYSHKREDLWKILK